jgi:hypothetical protein
LREIFRILRQLKQRLSRTLLILNPVFRLTYGIQFASLELFKYLSEERINMDFQLRFLNGKPSKFLVAYTEGKIMQRMERLMESSIYVILTLKNEKQGYLAKCRAIGDHGLHIELEEVGTTRREAIDLLVRSLDNRIQHIKGRQRRLRLVRDRMAGHIRPSYAESENTIDAEEIIKFEQATKSMAEDNVVQERFSH